MANALVIVDKGVVFPGEPDPPPPPPPTFLCPGLGCDPCPSSMTITATGMSGFNSQGGGTTWPGSCSNTGPCFDSGGGTGTASYAEILSGCTGTPSPANCGNGVWFSEGDVHCVPGGLKGNDAVWLATVVVGVSQCGEITVQGVRTVLEGDECPPAGNYALFSYTGNNVQISGSPTMTVSITP